MNRPPPRHPSVGPPGRPAAFTLVELLVASTLAFIVMGALVLLFARFARAVANAQELAQLGARMRSTAWQLRRDIQGATSEVKPFIRPESAGGYFEIIEGPLVDSGTTMVADVDDILMLTTASVGGRPFTGLLSGTIAFESPVAEVAWFCKQSMQQALPGIRLYNLYRRQLLVAAAPGAGAFAQTNSVAFTSWDTFFLNNDLSVRREGSMLIANSLVDLTRRESRFLHNVTGAANPVLLTTWPQISATTSAVTGMSETLTDLREGEDLLLANVIAFDVRVFDPAQANGGSYVHLGSGTAGNPGTTPSLLSGTVTLSGTGVPPAMRIDPVRTAFPLNSYKFYDTSSLHTEWNNIGDLVTTTPSEVTYNRDRGTNWDDAGKYSSTSGSGKNGVVDDAGELEQPPPYSVPLRGVEIRIRCFEPSSQEVRQVTVQHSFLAR